MAIYAIDDKTPRLGADTWVADTAVVIGEVETGKNVTVWYGAVVRGDCGEVIRIGDNSNIQDGSVLHADFGMPLTLGNDVTVGHMVMLHGCTIGDGTLVGIGAIVLNGARIGRNCVVGAGAVVTEGKEFPDNSMIVGAPAKAIRTMDEEKARKFREIAGHYVENGQRYAKGLKRIG